MTGQPEEAIGLWTTVCQVHMDLLFMLTCLIRTSISLLVSKFRKSGLRENTPPDLRNRCNGDVITNCTLVPAEIETFLNKGGIKRLAVGHQPHGFAPSIIKSAKLEVIDGDTSYRYTIRAHRLLGLLLQA